MTHCQVPLTDPATWPTLSAQSRAGATIIRGWLSAGYTLDPYGTLKTEGPAPNGSLFWSGPLFLWRRLLAHDSLVGAY